MGRTTVNGCLLPSVSSNFGGNVFPLEELGIGMQTVSQTPTYFASSKTVFLQVSRKPGDSEPASEENKQFDLGGKEGSHRFEKRMYWYYFLFCGGTLGLDARLVSCAFACLPVLCLFRFVFYYRKIR